MPTPDISIRSPHLNAAEISWFAPICNGDFEYMGDMDNHLKSNWANASNILLTADKLGYRNILCPSSYQVGQDTMSFVAACAPPHQKYQLAGGSAVRRNTPSYAGKSHRHY